MPSSASLFDGSEALPRAPLALRWPIHPAPLGVVLHARRTLVASWRS